MSFEADHKRYLWSQSGFRVGTGIRENPIPLKDIAQSQELAEKYLEQLLALLKKAGIVQTVRGASGGYILSAPPNCITVNQVLTALEGDMSIVECQRGKKCKNEDTCATKAVWQRISQSITTALEEITLQNMVDDYNAGQAAKEMTK